MIQLDVKVYYGVIDLYHQRSVRKSAYRPGETTSLRKCDFHFGIWQASSLCSFDASNVYVVLSLFSSSAPGFYYARSAHITTLIEDESIPDGFLKEKKSDELSLALELRSSSRNASEDVHAPEVNSKLLYLSAKVHRGPGVQLESLFTLSHRRKDRLMLHLT